MIIEIPLRKVPAQSFSIVLNEQACTIALYQRLNRLFCDLQVDGGFVWRSMICHDRFPIKRFVTQKFTGNLVFVDQNGTERPQYAQFGERFRLYYITDDVLLDDTFQRRGTEDV